MIQAAVVSHHLIEFTRQCLRGAREASFYAPSRPRPSAAALRPIRLQREEVSR
jgi:hypothetical protein